MDAYVGAVSPGPQQGVLESIRQSTDPLNVGLLVVNDTTDRNSSPGLSANAKSFLADHVKQRVEAGLPIRVVKVLDPIDVPKGQPPPQLGSLAREAGVPYLLVAVFSNEESEVPLKLPITGDPEQGGNRPVLSGFEMRTNALAELALIESASERVIARTDGRAWNRLNRLYVPLQSNSYPVIHRSLRVAPIYPREDNAKDVARSLAGEEAAEQAVFQLQESWQKPGA